MGEPLNGHCEFEDDINMEHGINMMSFSNNLHRFWDKNITGIIGFVINIGIFSTPQLG